MYDNPHVKPQNQFHWQRNFESMQSKRDSCRSSKGVILEDAKRTALPRATRTANTLAANIGTDVRVHRLLSNTGDGPTEGSGQGDCKRSPAGSD